MQMKRRQRARELSACLQESSTPYLTTIHASRNDIRRSEPRIVTHCHHWVWQQVKWTVRMHTAPCRPFWCLVSMPELLRRGSPSSSFYCLRFCLSSNHHLSKYYFLPLSEVTSEKNNSALAETIFFTTLCLLYAGWSSNAYQPNTCGCHFTPFVKPV